MCSLRNKTGINKQDPHTYIHKYLISKQNIVIYRKQPQSFKAKLGNHSISLNFGLLITNRQHMQYSNNSSCKNKSIVHVNVINDNYNRVSHNMSLRYIIKSTNNNQTTSCPVSYLEEYNFIINKNDWHNMQYFYSEQITMIRYWKTNMPIMYHDSQVFIPKGNKNIQWIGK